MADGQVDDLQINELKSLNCFGVFSNLDNAYYDDDDDELHIDTQAQAYFQRNVDVGGSLRLGVETSVTTGGVTTYTNSGGNILVKKNGVTYILSPQKVAYLTNITSDIQDQIDNTTSNFQTQIDNIFSQDEILFDGNEFETSLNNCIIDATTSIKIGNNDTTGTIIIGNEASRGSILINNDYLKLFNTNATGIMYLDAKTLRIGTSELASIANNNIYIGNSNSTTTFKGSLSSNGTSNFNTTIFRSRPTLFLTSGTITSNSFISKGDADTLYIVKTTNNTWTGTNAFNISRPTSSLITTPAINEFITKRDADSLYGGSGGTTLTAVQSNNNLWTGTNRFNTSRPSSTLITTPTINEFITKRDADALYSTPSSGATLAGVQSNNNTWTGTNAFNTSRPKSTLIDTPSDNDFITKRDFDDLVISKADVDSPIFENLITTPQIKFADVEEGTSSFSGLNIISETDYSIRYNVVDFFYNHTFSCASLTDTNTFTDLLKIDGDATTIYNTLNVGNITLNGVDLNTKLGTFITSSSLSTTLASSYVTPLSLSTTLASYVTPLSLSTTLASYITPVSLTDTLLSYVKNISLTSTLASYVTSLSLTSTLLNYVTSLSLTDTLLNYVTSLSLTSTLLNYVTSLSLTSTLLNYVTSLSLSTTLLSYVTSLSLSTTLEDYVLKSNFNSVQTITTTNSYISPPLYNSYIVTGEVRVLTLQAKSTDATSDGMEIMIRTDVTYYNQNNILYGPIMVNGNQVASIALSKNATFRFLYYNKKYYLL